MPIPNGRTQEAVAFLTNINPPYSTMQLKMFKKSHACTSMQHCTYQQCCAGKGGRHLYIKVSTVALGDGTEESGCDVRINGRSRLNDVADGTVKGILCLPY